ncbi:hypothetical protein HDV01_003764 [Terramyces sp. JEL0728]|nr:hypothetical protein HDV01_003764 [Terramyces sp. JEL0728]
MISVMVGTELVQCYQPLFPVLTKNRLNGTKITVFVVYVLFTGSRTCKDLLFTSSEEPGFLPMWYKWGSPVAATLEVVYNIIYISVMIAGIYKISKRKSNRRQLEYINAKCKSALMFLALFICGVSYFGWVAAYIASIDNDDPESHLEILKLDVLLCQPMAIHVLVFLKLYYILLELFAKKDVMHSSAKSKVKKKGNHEDDTEVLKGSKRRSDENPKIPGHLHSIN